MSVNKTPVVDKRLYRPVGLKELKLIEASNMQKFPPRLEWQPIFYPVLNFEYAAQIANEWNTKDEFSGFAGFVTTFEIPLEYFQKFETHCVGGKIHEELWIPSEQLDEFNSRICNGIEIVASFYGEKFDGDRIRFENKYG